VRITRANPRMRVVDTSAGVEYLPDDPHIWLSPAAAPIQAGHILAALVAEDPEHAGEYRRNHEAFLARVAELDTRIRALFAGVSRRTFLVFHPAWGYFARDYGLQQLAIEEHGKSPGPVALGRAIELARSRGLRTIFVQPQFDRRTGETIARAIGGSVVVIDPLARDWAANLERAAGLLAASMR